MSFLHNLEKAEELQPQCQWAYRQWLNDCDNQGLNILVSEVYRSQERQNFLILIGRDSEDDFWRDYQFGKMSLSTARRGIDLLRKYGPFEADRSPVTWTLDSTHILRIACDVIALNCTYEQIEDVARPYGIYRPLSLIALGDVGHFQFDQCLQEPKQPTYTRNAIVRRFERMIKWTNSVLQKTRLQERLTKFLSK